MDAIYEHDKRKVNTRSLCGDEIIVICTFSFVLSFSIIFSSNLFMISFVCIVSSVIMAILLGLCFGEITIIRNLYFINSICFIALVALSAAWAQWEHTPPLANATQIFLYLIPNFFLFTYMYKAGKDIRLLINVLQVSSTIVAIYTYYFFGSSEFARLLSEKKRIGNVFANSNVIGVFIAIGALAYVYDLLYKRISVLKIVLLIPSVYVIAYSGSRKALITITLGVFVLWIYRFKGQNALSMIVKGIVSISILAFIGTEIFSLPIFSMIIDRMYLIKFFNSNSIRAMDHATYLRKLYLEIGLAAFRDAPFCGIGIGNTNTLIFQKCGIFAYTHNNYVEMLACLGVFGFIIYYAMWIVPLYILISSGKKSGYIKKEVFFCIVITMILLIMDFAMVPYLEFSNYFYIMIINVEAFNIQKRHALGEQL